ncbi:hypothetical protein [Streptomyces beijiangensis]|uniref:Lipoprotein n=1 Tax=Streptomyces beijiangensis TaxID=163361 RepID=A0A939FCK4_9ACTN|nr:hypothetical protein [Streptomyces beijiangensis]MBO0515543.1 hypothetical protein [Streptomyces beijiangensis]
MKAARTLAALVAATALAGCGASSDASDEKGMDLKAAAARADDITLTTLNAVKPGVKWSFSVSSGGLAHGAKAGPDATGTVTRRAAVRTIVSEERGGALAAMVEAGWKKQGYTITYRSSHGHPEVEAATKDGFQLSFGTGSGTQFTLIVKTPEARLSEVPAPTAKGTGSVDPAPGPNSANIRDAYWSNDGASTLTPS